MNTTPQPRRRRRAVTPENVFEETSTVQQSESVPEAEKAAPAAEAPKAEPAPAKKEAAELEWADDFAEEKAEKPAAKSKNKSKGKHKKKKKKGGCLKKLLLFLLVLLITAVALCWYLFPQRSKVLLEQTIGKVIPIATATPEPTPTPAPDSPVIYKGGTSGWIINQQEGYRLNLREDPSATAKSIGKYFTGTPLIFTGNQKNSFVQVLLAGTTFGWVDERFVTSDALSFVPETPTVTIKNSGSGAVLRSGPSSSYDRIGWFSHGTPVVVLGVHADGWHHVDINGQVGYISPSLLSGIFPYGNGLDSDNITHNSETTNSILNLYINTRSSGGQLHLRKSASVSAKSLGLFYTGTPVTVLSYTRDGWAYVRIGQSEGYMDADYLASLKPTQYGAQRTVRNSRATGLNLRSLPSTGGELLSFAPNYASITVLGELSDGWCYVEYNGQLGYMLGTYLK